MSINNAKVFFWSAARKRDEMLELYDGKLSRTVLRRESGSNPADLAGDDEVIEIDDGLRPCFFHVEDGAVKVLSGFQYNRARANQYEGQGDG